MGSDRDIVILADDVDMLVGRMRNDIDLRIAQQKARHHVAHRELQGRHGRGAAHGPARFMEPMAYGGLGQFGLTQHHHRMAIEFLAGIGHPEPP